MRAWNSKFFSQRRSSKLRGPLDVAFSHFKNLLIAQFGARGFFSTRLNRLNKFSPFMPLLIGISSLCNFVINIVLVVTKKQMVWINTGSIIALVKNPHAFWNFTNKSFMGKPMRIPSFFWRCKTPIPTPEFACNPHPTSSKMLGMFWDRSIFVYFRSEAPHFRVSHPRSLLYAT